MEVEIKYKLVVEYVWNVTLLNINKQSVSGMKISIYHGWPDGETS